MLTMASSFPDLSTVPPTSPSRIGVPACHLPLFSVPSLFHLPLCFHPDLMSTHTHACVWVCMRWEENSSSWGPALPPDLLHPPLFAPLWPQFGRPSIHTTAATEQPSAASPPPLFCQALTVTAGLTPWCCWEIQEGGQRGQAGGWILWIVWILQAYLWHHELNKISSIANS